jgi:Icc-related predicted phosphoesterase
MKIIAFGDIHEHTENIAKIVGIGDADCVIVTGDLTNFAGASKAKKIIELISSYNRRIYAQLGNLDHGEVNDYLDTLGINLHANGFAITEEIGIFGVGGSNPTPFNTPTEYTEQQLKEFMQKGYEKIKDLPLKILVAHAPPYNTTVDIVGDGVHVGSTAVRDFIETYDVRLCLTGHIHEAIGKDKIGETIIVNPGMLRDGHYIEVVARAGEQLEVHLKEV